MQGGADAWFITRRGRGLYTRTTALPLSSRFYVLAVLVQAVVIIAVNVIISVLVNDCLSALVLGLASVTTLFMSYFAIEAVRTENRYQLAAYAFTSAVFMGSYVPPIVGSSDGPMRVHMRLPRLQEEVRTLLLVALVCTCTLQLISLVLASLTYRLTYCTAGVPAVGMRTYKKVGTDPALLAAYQVYQRFCTMLKLDWLLQLQMLAFCVLGIHELSWQWIVTLAAQLPMACVWIPLGLLAVRRESGPSMLLLILAAAAQVPLYAAQLLTLPAPTHPHHNGTSPNGTEYAFDWVERGGGMEAYCTQRLRERTFPFASPALNSLYLIALLVRLFTLYTALLARSNFGKGLASRVHRLRGTGGDSLGSSYGSRDALTSRDGLGSTCSGMLGADGSAAGSGVLGSGLTEGNVHACGAADRAAPLLLRGASDATSSEVAGACAAAERRNRLTIGSGSTSNASRPVSQPGSYVAYPR